MVEIECDADDCDDPITPGDQLILVARTVKTPDGMQFVRGHYLIYHPACHDPNAVENVDVDGTVDLEVFRGG